MRKLAALAAATALCLLLATGVAAARRAIRVEPQEISLLAAVQLEHGLGTPIRCLIEIDMTINEAAPKRSGALVGSADIVMPPGCLQGDIGLLNAMGARVAENGPYQVTYRAFTGVLPNIASVSFRINDVVFWIEEPDFELNCLTNGAVDIDGTTWGENPAEGMDLNASVPLTGGFLCGFVSSTFTGEGDFFMNQVMGFQLD